MDILSNLLDILVKPSGLWPTIINAFESGVGSYLLAVVLITLILRVILSPFDLVNKRISKKQALQQEKIKPEIEKLQKKYGNDRALLNQKTNELYKKSGASLGGSCLFMLIFLALNLTIFFTLFSSLNSIADYKIADQYVNIKESYTNVLYLSDSYYQANGNLNILENVDNLNIEIVTESDKQVVKLKDGESVVYSVDYKNSYSYYNSTTKVLNSGDISDKVEDYNSDNTYTKIKIKETIDGNEVENEYYILTNKITKTEEVYTISEDLNMYELISSNKAIIAMMNKYINKIEGDAGYIGDTIISGEITFNNAITKLADKEASETYELTQKDYSFLWIDNIWVADSPFKSSVFTYEQYKKEVGDKYILADEEQIYTKVMSPISDKFGGANGYFILAIISMGVAFLTAWLTKKLTGNATPNPATSTLPGQKSGKMGFISLLIMPIIMGVFALFYNSLFAIYMIVSQAVAAAISPLSNVINKKWEAHDKKKEEAKQVVVDYRRK